MKTKKLVLKEYIAAVIKEDQGGGGGDVGGPLGGVMPDYSMWGPTGGVHGSSQDLFNIFVKPLLNPFETAVGQAKEITRKARTLLTVAFETVMTTLIPTLGDSYQEIFEKEKSDIESIRSKYTDVYKETESILGSADAKILAFLVSPAGVLAGKVASDGPGAVKNTLDIVTGGVSDNLLKKWEKFSSMNDRDTSYRSRREKPSDIFGESYVKIFYDLLKEEKKSSGKNKKKDSKTMTLADALGSKKFINSVLKKSPKFSEISKEATNTYKSTLKDAYEQASSVMKSKTIEDIEKIIGKKIKGSEELKKLSGEEKKASDEMLIKAVKASSKKLYTAPLKARVKEVIDAGIPEDNPFVVDHQEIIKKIEEL